MPDPKPPIRILHLEDTPRDAALIQDRLATAGLLCEIVHVNSREPFESALARESFDLILCDYNLAGYDGLSALKLAREKQPDTPVMLVSGSLGEEEAVKCLQLGATDYLLKQRLERLPSAVNRALEEAEQQRQRQQAEARLRESEARFRQLAENIDEVFWMTNLEKTQMIYVSPAYETIWGRTCASLYASPRIWLEAVHPEDRARISQAAFTNQPTGTYDEEYRIVRPDGTLRWIHDRAFPVRNQAGEMYRIAGVANDITNRKLAEEARRESEERYRDLFENAHDLIQSVRPDGTLRYVNRAWRETLGYSEAEIPGLSLMRDIIHPSSLTHCTEMFQRLLAGDSLDCVEAVYRTKDGRVIVLEGNCSCHFVNGQPEYTRQIFRDVTARKLAEEARRESEERYRSLVEESPDAIGIYLEDKLVFINATGARQLGAKSKEELLGRKGEEIIHPDDRPAASERIKRRLAGATDMYPAEVRYRRLDGTTLAVEVIATPISFGGQAAVQFISRDITERKRAEEALQRSESQFRLIWENSVDGMRLTDAEGTVLMVNEAFCRLVGKPRAEIEGKPMCDIYAEEGREPILARHRARFASRTVPAHLEHQLKLWDGREIWLEVTNCFFEPEPSRPILLGVFRNITARKLAERQMLRTQRLESIGTLAGGIAHDLNNALAPIMMATELLRLEFPDTATSYLEMIQASAKRGADMVKQLLTFAKGVEGERLRVQPQRLLKEMEKLITSTFPKNIQLQTRYAKDLQSLLGDATQLHQVLLNLCVNARDAMPAGGTLTLEAENREIDPAYARTVPEAKPGPYVMWRVTDTGAGMAPEILERIFEPFFSTKGPDKGTGLGLSTMIGIVKGHGGFVQVSSTPGQGSTFAVYLPAYGSGSGDTSRLTKTNTTFRGHGETILVVDDEVSVRNILRAVLTQLNFKVLTAADGTTALIQVAENQADLRAVITDLHMPHMDGLAFVRVLKGRLPQVGIIVVSGRLDEREADEFKLLGVHAVLEKPFTQEKLVAALKIIFPK